MSETIINADEESHFTPDSIQMTPRCVIAVFPFIVREIFPQIIINEQASKLDYQDYLNLRNKVIIIADDILSANVNTAKGNPNHTMQASLVPLGSSTIRKKGATAVSISDNNVVDYMQRIAPGDYVMCWLVNGVQAQQKLIEDLRSLNKPVNGYDSGLKFVGQLMTIQESYRVTQSGLKQKRYTIGASGFNQYNAQIFFSPFVAPKAGTATGGLEFAQDFYKTIEDNVVKKLYAAEGGALSIQKQFKSLHKLLLGAGPGKTTEANPIRSANGAFGVPTEVAQALGRRVPTTSEFTTYADICSVLIGVQQYDNSEQHGQLGPAFDLETSVTFKGRSYGMYYEPKSPDYYLKGRKNLKISPTVGGTVYSLLQQVSNPSVNEMYFTLRPDPTKEGFILPTLVCRQLPFVTHLIEDIKGFTYTNYFELPRFKIASENILSYDLSRNDAMRLNTVMVRMSASIPKPNLQEMLDAISVKFGNWAFDGDDIKRHGQRFYPVTVDQDLITLDSSKRADTIRKYTAFLSSVVTNQHLKYSGSIQSVGMFIPICVGDNCQFNDLIFHIESIAHSYQVSNGIPSFRTTLNVSHGIHKSGKYDALSDAKNYKPFNDMGGGVIKEGLHETEFISPSSREDSSSGTDNRLNPGQTDSTDSTVNTKTNRTS